MGWIINLLKGPILSREDSFEINLGWIWGKKDGEEVSRVWETRSYSTPSRRTRGSKPAKEMSSSDDNNNSRGELSAEEEGIEEDRSAGTKQGMQVLMRVLKARGSTLREILESGTSGRRQHNCSSTTKDAKRSERTGEEPLDDFY